jgi:hypothetical protein
MAVPVTSTLIVDCPSCRDPSLGGRFGRQDDGLREWVADFELVSTADGGTQWWPVRGLPALSCPDCGEPGRVWSY